MEQGQQQQQQQQQLLCSSNNKSQQKSPMYGTFSNKSEGDQQQNQGSNSNSNNRTSISNTQQQSDAFIASALSTLSLKDREHLYHDVHGVSDLIPENTEFRAQQLQALDRELSKFRFGSSSSSSSKNNSNIPLSAFHLAESMSPHYVQNPDFLLSFLRATSYDAKEAAERLVHFLDMKLTYFGKDLLCQDVQLEDLHPHEIKALEVGFFQFLPYRDRSGRAVAIHFPSHQTYKEPIDLGRLIYYMIMSALEDVETQIKGMVLIVYFLGEFSVRMFDPRSVQLCYQTSSYLPIRVVSVHHCYDNDATVHHFISLALKLGTQDFRARAKLHNGTPLECIYGLMTYGIPSKVIPIHADTVSLKRKNHSDWIKMRRKQEKQIISSRLLLSCSSNDQNKNKNENENENNDTAAIGMTFVHIPSHTDVLLGRGKTIQDHVGNLRLRNHVDNFSDRYSTAVGHKAKKIIITEIVDLIRQPANKNQSQQEQQQQQQQEDDSSPGGRFLKKHEDGMWIVVDETSAREKVSHTLRDRKRAKKILLANSSSSVGNGKGRDDEHGSKRARSLFTGMG